MVAPFTSFVLYNNTLCLTGKGSPAVGATRSFSTYIHVAHRDSDVLKACGHKSTPRLCIALGPQLLYMLPDESYTPTSHKEATPRKWLMVVTTTTKSLL